MSDHQSPPTGKAAILDAVSKLNSFMILQVATSTLVSLILSHPNINGKEFAVGAASASLGMVGICAVLVAAMAKYGGFDRYILLRLLLLAVNAVLIAIGLWSYNKSDYLASVLVYGGAVIIDMQWLFFEILPTFAEMKAFQIYALHKICCRK